MVKVKVCGITNLRDAQAAAGFGADALGFIFADSPRRISPEKAQAIIRKLGPFVTTVGVFVNRPVREILQTAEALGLDAVQLHGDETETYTKKLGCCKVIKAFRVGEGTDWNRIHRFPADAYLFDTKIPGRYGGSGRTFDWKPLKRRNFPRPVILSGGLNPGNVAAAIRMLLPYGVDVSSGVEKKPGIKDHALLSAFIKNAKKG